MLNLDFSNYKGVTWLKDWWKIVKGHFTEVQTAINANETAISDEATERQKQDGILQANIDSEATERARQVNILSDQVDDLTHLYDVVDSNTYLADDVDEPPAPDVGVLFKFYNNTASTVRTGFSVQIGDETYLYKFSEPIYAHQTRLCVVTLTPKPDEGEIYVLSDTELRNLVKTAQAAADNANASVTAEATARQQADTALQGEIDALIPPNVRFVLCTGENDQVAIQAALTAVGNLGGGTVYPCGDCLLSNTGVTQTAFSPTNYTAVLNIPKNVTLDFENATTVLFSNGTPVTNQVIFSLDIGAKLRNIGLLTFENNDGETNPRIINARSKNVMDNCNFGSYYAAFGDTSTIGGYTLNESVISNCTFGRYTAEEFGDERYMLHLKSGSKMYNCTVKEYTPLEDEGYLVKFMGSGSLMMNCEFTRWNGSSDINVFIDCGAITRIIGNKFTNVRANIGVGDKSEVKDNIYVSSSLHYKAIDTGKNCKVSGNRFIDCTYSMNISEMPIISVDQYTDIHDNVIGINNIATSVNAVGVIGCKDGSTVQGNTVKFGDAATATTTPTTVVVGTVTSVKPIITDNVVYGMPSGATMSTGNVTTGNNYVDGELLI